MEREKMWIHRSLIGAALGVTACILLAWLTQPGWIFGGHLTLDFTFCYNSAVPEALGAVLGIALWALFGAEVGIATIPFADDGRELVVRSLLHFAVTALTAGAWIVLNFGWVDIPLCLFLLAVGYLIIWLTRWVGWYSEINDIREKLGLSPAVSPLKWKEILPYLLLLGVVYGLAMPVLGIFDGPIPFFSGVLLPYIVYPILAGAVGFHTGKHCGFTVLVPIAVYLLSLLNDFWLWLARVLDIANMAYGYASSGLVYAAIALVCHIAGALVRVKRRQIHE